MKGGLALLWTILAVSLAVTACTKSTGGTQGQGVIDREFVMTRAALSTRDFSSVLNECDVITSRDSDPKASLAAVQKHQRPGRVLTRGEERMAGTIVLPDGKAQGMMSVVMCIIMYYETYNKLPKDGLDTYLEMDLAETVAELSRMDEHELFCHISYAVNPITGKVYDGFNKPIWSPGGIRVEKLAEGVEQVRVLRPTNCLSADGVNPPRIYRYVLNGEEPGSILVDSTVSVNCKEDPNYVYQPDPMPTDSQL